MPRLAVGVLALFAVASQVGVIAHLALVEHVACSEHGELVEVSQTRASATPSLASPEVGARFTSDSQRSHGHDHCQLATLRRPHTSPTPASHASTSALVAMAPGHPVKRSPPSSLSPLQLAPKTSPPSTLDP